jgi:hypothetical protein
MKKLQKKQAGFIVSAELVLIATILVIGLVVGMVAIRDAMTAEMGDVAEAIGNLDQSYSFDGINDAGTGAIIGASMFDDGADNTGGPILSGIQGFAGDQTGIDFVTPVESPDEGTL